MILPEITRGFSVNDLFQSLILLSLVLNLDLSIGVVVVEEVRLGGRVKCRPCKR
jgi:hypothetical protein